MICGYSPRLIAEKEKHLVEAANAARGDDALMKVAAHALFHQTHMALSGKIPCLAAKVGKIRPLSERRILVLVGAGNNGGDGLYAARDLTQRGYPVTVLATSQKIHEQGAAAARQAGVEFWPVLAEGAGENHDATRVSEEVRDKIIELAPAAIIDAIIGIGARPPLREPALSLVRALNEWLITEVSSVSRENSTIGANNGRDGQNLLSYVTAPRPIVVACDHPSGIDLEEGSDLGESNALLKADLTVTMGAPKTGMLVGQGASAVGHLEIQEIGLDNLTPEVAQITREDVAQAWSWPKFSDHKYSRGVLSVLAGSAKYPGAGVLVTTAALASGASFVRYLGEDAVQPLVLGASPEVVIGSGHSQALVMGSGFDGHDENHRGQLLGAWEAREPEEYVVLDAGALSLVGRSIETDDRCLLTPHAGEAAVLASGLGLEASREEIEANPYRWARKLAAASGATVLLKGPATTIANPDGTVYSVTHGTRDLATAGSGDALAGILGFLFASTRDITDLGFMAAVGAWIHGEAGRLAAPTPRTTDIINAIRPAVAALRSYVSQTNRNFLDNSESSL
ncbi:MAG: bifunctional ADP-dependent NAD(P)H-hydrate dehydratase/NAD(P)H-hydrate epimerase [Mobiluncus sp.]|uniref:bifunctional ADP-dependent NAD(P)H-hydrate dehydratase/NAD(P)H-hydrate epimerase n=1 Tax=Mobiluncus sp. TaxID=47293 RepID=UPI00259115DE|nr:bifunctional ADP-dependent NAD(P)H-hydrate dehydratase/NAD(P)H-hydrate epimerase [Mobiluncus sp.]MCI6583874.1 bifunctional ADP-dependent NAD(P)H-hydrate dehydratase/NAD(P)H-hydrate epimerase [Mobiluncus sp.]